MRNRKLLSLAFERTYLLLKSTGFLFFVPIIIVDIIIPALNAFSYSAHGVGDELYNRILEITQIFIPFLSVWWVIFILREFVDADGCELLYTSKKTPAKSSIFMAFGIYCLNIMVLYIPYCLMFKNFALELIKILMICIFFFGAALFFSKITGSTSITIFLLVMYMLINLIDFWHEGKFPIYLDSIPADIMTIFTNSMPLALCGIALLLTGLFIRRQK